MADISDDRAEIILVADDETIVRLLANDILTDAGYRVLEAPNGRETPAVLAIRKDVRLLFTDVNMPSVNGLALAKLVQDRWPRIAIVITSKTVKPPGAATFVAKPYTRETVRRAIEEALDTVCPA